MPVGVGEGVEQLAGERPRARPPPPADLAGEIAPGDVPERDPGRLGVRVEPGGFCFGEDALVEHRDDVRVIEGRREVNLRLHPGEALGGEHGVHDLDRHRQGRPLVPREPHPAHASGPEEAHDVVPLGESRHGTRIAEAGRGARQGKPAHCDGRSGRDIRGVNFPEPP